MHVYTITVAFYLIIKSKFSLSSLTFVLSSPVSLFSLTLFNPKKKKKKDSLFPCFLQSKEEEEEEEEENFIDRKEMVGLWRREYCFEKWKNKERERKTVCVVAGG